MKRAGRKSFHKHYLLLMFLCIILALFGTEAGQSTMLLHQNSDQAETILHLDSIYDAISSESGDTSDVDISSLIGSNAIVQTIITGDFDLGEQISDTIEQNMPAEYNGIAALGTTSGVLAGLFNNIMSGRFYLKIVQGLFKATQSKTAAQVLFFLITALVYLALYIFIRNVFSGMIRRMFLESRTYEKVPFLDIIHFAVVRKWFRACWTLFLKTFFLTLWSLTIIGGIIKHYSYYLVPFIVAENPGIKSLEAITLSRRMMKGHKWEAFVFDLSYIGWYILAVVTMGISDAFYGFPYRTAGRTEYYVYLRNLAKENKIRGAEALNDTYLYEIAEKIPLYEAYFDIVDRQTLVLENKVELTKVKAFFVKWFSIWLGKYEEKKRYDEVEAHKYEINRGIMARDGKSYPIRLNPLWMEKKKKAKKTSKPFHFLRAYSIWTLILMFILFCFIGWGWEVCLYLVRTGGFVNRGFMHGPWLPIYGCGGIVVLIICSRFRSKPVVELIVSVVLCGVIEYLGAVMLETKYHERWWSYDGCFLNINGRVCAEGLIVFGIACMLVVYLIAPVFDALVTKMPKKVLIIVSVGLLVVFLIDFVYSRINPNMSEGAIEASTELPSVPSVPEQMRINV